MASCYICNASYANQRREIYTGQSRRINFGKRITFGKSNHYGMRTVCNSCAKEMDFSRNLKVVFWQILIILFLLYVYLH